MVGAQLDDFLITFLGRAAGRTREVRRGQFVEHGIDLDSPEKTQLSLRQPVEHFAMHVAGVDAQVENVRQWLGQPQRFLEESQHALRGVDLLRHFVAVALRLAARCSCRPFTN